MTPVAAKSETGASLPWLWLAGVFVAALLVRVAYLAAFRHSPFFENLLVDAAWHDLWAWGWAEGTWDTGGRAFFRAPLYPLFVSLVYKGFGHDLVALRAVQALIGSTTAMGIAACAFDTPARVPDEAFEYTTQIVVLADAIARATGYGAPVESGVSLLAHPANRLLRMSDVRIGAIRIDLSDRLREIIPGFGIEAVPAVA